MKPLLEVNNLSISLKKQGIPIVEGVSFQVKKGQILGMIGESGSGKSMTCRGILGLLDTHRFSLSGTASFQGQNLFQLTPKEMQMLRGEKITMVMQNPMTAFDPVCKVGRQMLETLHSHRKLSKVSAMKSIKAELERLGLADTQRIMDSYPYELSGGMLQRIMIALALLLSPELIIADEATTALDVRTQGAILEEFSNIREAGITMIIVTHNFGILAKLADEVVVLKDGGIVERGDVFEIFDKPTQGYTKKLLQASNLRKEISNA